MSRRTPGGTTTRRPCVCDDVTELSRHEAKFLRAWLIGLPAVVALVAAILAVIFL
jgi:hypothetical protein